jgi:hypothetical protein
MSNIGSLLHKFAGQHAHVAITMVFHDQPPAVRCAVAAILSPMLGNAERLYRQWLRRNAKHLTPRSPQAARIASTIDGVELVLHVPVYATSRTYAVTDAGTLLVTYQVRDTDRKWNIPSGALRVVADNLSRRQPRVPVRPFEAVLVSERAAAA